MRGEILGLLSKTAADLLQLEKRTILHLLGIRSGYPCENTPEGHHVLRLRFIAVDVGHEALESADPARSVQIDPQLLPGFPADRLIRGFSGSHVAAHTRVPSAGKEILARGSLLQVHPAGLVEQVEVYHRLDQLGISVALAAGSRADRIPPAIDQLEKLLAHRIVVQLNTRNWWGRARTGLSPRTWRRSQKQEAGGPPR